MLRGTPLAFVDLEVCACLFGALIMAAQALIELRVEPEDIEARYVGRLDSGRAVDQQKRISECCPWLKEGSCGEEALFKTGEVGEIEEGERSPQIRWDLVLVGAREHVAQIYDAARRGRTRHVEKLPGNGGAR